MTLCISTPVIPDATHAVKQGEISRSESDLPSPSASLIFSFRYNTPIAETRTPTWRHRLKEIKVPTLVIHGTDDPVLPYPHGVALSKEIPGAKLVTMEGVGHELPRGCWPQMLPAIVEHTVGS